MPQSQQELFDLAYDGNADALDAYLTAGHDINHEKSGAYHIGPLLTQAAHLNNIPMAERLLSNNPKPNIERTALNFAFRTKDSDTRMLSLLLDHQTNVNKKDYNGFLSFNTVFRIKHFTLLLNHGADVDAVNSNGLTALIYAQYGEEKDVITAVTSQLLEHGANPFIQSHHGHTAAHVPEVKAHMNWLVGQVVERATAINAGMSPLLETHLIPDLANMVNEYLRYGNIGNVSIDSLSKNPTTEPNPERKAQLELQQLVLKDVLGAYAQTKKEEREIAASAAQAIFTPSTPSSPQWRERIAPTRSASAPLPSSSQGR